MVINIDYNLEDAYNSYFNKDTPIKDNSTHTTDTSPIVNNTIVEKPLIDYSTDNLLKMATNNIDNIDDFAESLRQILNAAWGDDWGSISPALSKSNNTDQYTLPQITYDIYSRETAEKTPIKPIKTDTIKEIVNGQETGDSIIIYRQWFDCIIEFNVWGNTSFEARETQVKFETLMQIYTGYFKKSGISNLVFLKEIPALESGKYVDGLNMKCILYGCMLEKITTIRASTIKQINLKLSAIQNTEQNSSDIYKTNKIKFTL